MTQTRGPWTIQDSLQKYRNAFIQVYEDQVLQPDGTPGQYATVTMKAGIAVLPIAPNQDVYLVQQFRYALGQTSIEVVCGALEDQEPPLPAAQREVQEELGIQAEEWSDLGMIDLDTSIVRCPVNLFLARHLSFTQPEREGTETIETLKMPLSEAVQRVLKSEITHGPSCVLILKAWHLLSEQKSVE